MTPPKFVGKMAKAGFDFNRFAAAGVARESSGGPAATIAELRACQSRRTAPPGPKDTWLGEAFVHGEDIRRPLGIKREYPLDWVSRALTFYSGSEPIVHGKSRVAGVTLHVTDTDLRLGSGPEAAGPVLSLLLVASGRGAVLDELSGPGVDLLRSRL
jgi:uncharacterized protein (TIGR03083 family)